MKLEDLLGTRGIHLREEFRTGAEALAHLLTRGRRGEVVGVAEAESLLERMRSGDGGALWRVAPLTLVVHRRIPGDTDPGCGLLVNRSGLLLESGEEGDRDPGPRILLVLETAASEGLHGSPLERLARVLRDPTVEGSLLAAQQPSEVLALRKLMEVALDEPVRVSDVLVPLPYRVFPDTPLGEVVDLMARKGLQALPVVGEDLRVLGVVTAGEALRHALQRRGRGVEEVGARPIGTARDVMNRTVMCVSEEQDLLDAAQLMVNKSVGQLPVVRDGEIVGILTRDAVLGALFGGR
jgi:CBS domain-containing protein